MKLFNCHSHTKFSHDGKGTVEELCNEAIKNELFGFTVSDHCDCEFSFDKKNIELIENSFFAAKKAQLKYKEALIISCGVEIGEVLFDPVFAKHIINLYQWDVILGSVHAVRIKDYMMPFSVIDFSEFDDSFISEYIKQYFYDLLEMVNTADFDILCHLTVVLRYIVYKYKRKINLKEFYPVITEILKKIIELDKTLEINTSGFSSGYLMPNLDILEIYRSLGGHRITLGSDSHTPENIAVGLKESALLLKKAGFDTLTYYINRKPVEYKI
ncbi:MAG: histidinol-phosphatase HisJ family protein [Clostridia bacterium]|nr:histidinol-phosphatase HisJ family protein [Clostridia bacterium]